MATLEITSSTMTILIYTVLEAVARNGETILKSRDDERQPIILKERLWKGDQRGVQVVY